MQANVENKGWLDEVSNDVVCGTERQGLRMESIRIRLLNVENYHVFYCVCIKGGAAVLDEGWRRCWNRGKWSDD